MIDEIDKLLTLERKACITKTIEWFFIQLNEGDMECGDIEKFVANYKKYMEEINYDKRRGKKNSCL